MFKEGETFKRCYGPGKPYKCHVLAIVDEQMIVFKYYLRSKKRWAYDVELYEYCLSGIEIADKRLQKIKDGTINYEY